MNKLEECQKIAKNKEGKCLSHIYVNSTTKLSFQCKYNHIWNTTPKLIKNGYWCPTCAILSKTETIENLKNIAMQRGGECLSSSYIRNSKLEWKCNLGHVWSTKANNIKAGKWCPICSTGIGERTTRYIFEEIFGHKFLKIRPDWLKNKKSNCNLELDGYCSELNIAFEYNGDQHYEDVKIFTRSQYDDLKHTLCNENGIFLFKIDQIKSLNHYNDIVCSIRKQCANFGLQFNDKPINIDKVYQNMVSINYLEELRAIAIKNNGICLSDKYFDSSKKLKFKCYVCNCEWSSAPFNIKRGRWCPSCALIKKSENNRIDISEYQNSAILLNLKLLSSEIIHSRQQVKCLCSQGHEVHVSANRLRKGTVKCKICKNGNS